MRHQLFEDIVEPSVRVGRRGWCSMPLSLLTHMALIGALLVVPFVGSLALPAPQVVLAFQRPPAPLPPPSVLVEPVAPTVVRPVVNADAAPVEAPARLIEPQPAPAVVSARPTLWTAPRFAGWRAESALEAIAAPAPPVPATVEQTPLRVGGAVGEPRKVHHVAPVYPAIARAARREGLVIIEATIAQDGRVVDAQVLRSHPLFDEAALDAVRQWRYTPPTLNGEPVSVLMTVTVRFTMN